MKSYLDRILTNNCNVSPLDKDAKSNDCSVQALRKAERSNFWLDYLVREGLPG